MKKIFSRILNYAAMCLMAVAIAGLISPDLNAQKRRSKSRPSANRSSKQSTVVITLIDIEKLEFVLYPSGQLTLNKYSPVYNNSYNPAIGSTTTKSFSNVPRESEHGSWVLDWMPVGNSNRQYYYKIQCGGREYYMYRGQNLIYNNYKDFRNYGSGFKVEVTTR